MSNSLNITSNDVAKVFNTQTERTDSIVLLCKDEHTVRTPSTLEIKRKLPGETGTVLRATVSRRVTKVLDEGTESERLATAIIKTEYSIPVGFQDSDVVIMEDDIVGTIKSQTMKDLREFGLLSPQ